MTAALPLDDGELALTTSAGLTLTVRRMRVRRFNGRAMLYVGFTNGSSVTLNIALGRVQEVCDVLTAVLAEVGA